MFKDNCCKREILALQIYCRNEARGCAEQLTLGHLLVSRGTGLQVSQRALSCRDMGEGPGTFGRRAPGSCRMQPGYAVSSCDTLAESSSLSLISTEGNRIGRLILQGTWSSSFTMKFHVMYFYISANFTFA